MSRQLLTLQNQKLNLPGLPRDKLMESGFLMKSVIAGFSYVGFQFLEVLKSYLQLYRVSRGWPLLRSNH